MTSIWSLSILFLLATALTKIQPEKNEPIQRKIYRSKAQEIKLQQKKRKDEIAIHNNNYKSFNFKLNKSSQFIIKPDQDRQIKAVLDVYWNQNNVYLQATVLADEQVSVTVQEDDRSILISQKFYTGLGFKINLKGGKSYKITLKENGNYTKIIMMHLSQAISPSNTTAKLKEMVVLESKLLIVQRKLANGLKLASTGLLLQKRINQEILKQSTNYSYFEILETLFILFAAFLEVKLVTNLLKTDSIV